MKGFMSGIFGAATSAPEKETTPERKKEDGNYSGQEQSYTPEQPAALPSGFNLPGINQDHI